MVHLKTRTCVARFGGACCFRIRAALAKCCLCAGTTPVCGKGSMHCVSCSGCVKFSVFKGSNPGTTSASDSAVLSWNMLPSLAAATACRPAAGALHAFSCVQRLQSSMAPCTHARLGAAAPASDSLFSDFRFALPGLTRSPTTPNLSPMRLTTAAESPSGPFDTRISKFCGLLFSAWTFAVVDGRLPAAASLMADGTWLRRFEKL
jgi:hypothetical protein